MSGDGIIRRKTKDKELRYLVRPYDPITGRKGRGKTFDTLKAARDYKAESRKRGGGESKQTCRELVERWLTHGEQSKRRSTIVTQSYALRPFLAEFGNCRIGEIDKLTAREFAIRFPRAGVVARAVFGQAMEDGLVPSNPFANLRLTQSRGRQDIRVISQDELDSLIAAAHSTHAAYGPQFAAMIQFAAHVGLRVGEQCALTWDDIDLTRGRVAIKSSVSRQGEVTPPKNGRPRTVHLPPPARDSLTWFSRRLDSPFVFLSKRGRMLTATAHYAIWNPVRAAAGLPDFAWHELRHFAATSLFEMGASPSLVALQLGHEDKGQRVTYRYLHPDRERGLVELEELWRENVKPLKSVTSRSHAQENSA